jgi:hypothetical protein
MRRTGQSHPVCKGAESVTIWPDAPTETMTSTDRSTASPLLLIASFDAMYGSTVVRLRMEAVERFRARVSGQLLRVTAGNIETANLIQSEETSAQRQVAEVDVIGWLTERPIGDETAQGAANRYGISFFPFVSSFFRGEVDFGGQQLALRLIIDVPDTMRILYAQAHASFDGRGSVEPRHTMAGDRAQFLFVAPADASELSADVALRFGGARLAELVTYPVSYYSLSLVGIAVAALAGTTAIVVTAVGALWTFMLREWSRAAVPRRSTLLSAAYVTAAVTAAVWGALWEVAGWWAAFATIPVLALVGGFIAARRQFDRSGELPSPIRRIWRRRVLRSNA